MAITQNGSKSLIKSLFGYNYAATAASANAALVTGSSVSGLTVTLGSAQSVAANTQVILTVSSTTYVGLCSAATTSSTTLVVDGWFTQGTTTVTSSLTGSALTVALVAQPLPAYYLGLSSATITNYGQTTESTFTELTASGLGRAKATVAVTSVSTPTGSTNTTSTITLSNTWTYTGSTAVTVNDIAVYNAPYVASRSNDTMLFCTQVASAPTVTTNGDQLVVTETISQS